MRSIFIFFIAAVLFISCEEPVVLDLDQTPSKIVIEGQVTDQPGKQFVKVSRSGAFYTSGKTPRIADAVVTVTDDLGNTTTFVHNPNNHADSMGIYIPTASFHGEVGRTYRLSVVADGETYQAEDLLQHVIPMDSLGYEINEDQLEDPEDEGKIYEVLMFAREPQDEKNFYLFKFYRNDSLIFFNDTDIYYSDDELLAEKIDGVPSPIYFAKSDKARVEIYGISRTAFVYYNDLWSLLNNDSGGMFGPIPSSPRTNLSNGALGFFQVSGMHSLEVQIE